MTSYSIAEVAGVVGGKLLQHSGGKINYLLIDSRKVLFARESLFFALKGINSDGHFYIPNLYEAGVRNFVVQHLPANTDDFPRANFLVVNNSLQALHKLIVWHRMSMDIPVIGITGSNGKTIVKEWIYQCMNRERFIIRNPKSFNSKIGVPLSVWQLTPDAKLGVFEAGISLPGEMATLEQMIQPTIGVFTNIGDAHQENFTDIKVKIQEKLKLFRAVKKLVYCSDYELIESEIHNLGLQDSAELFSWGRNQGAKLFIDKIERAAKGASITGVFDGNKMRVSIPFRDKASIENAIHVWCVMLLFGYPLEVIEERLARLEPVGMRLELKEGINNCTIVNDTYNSDIESVRIALDFLGQQQQHSQRILIISDILQSGFQQRDLYRQVAGMIAQKKIDRIIGIGPSISEHADLFTIKKDFFDSTEDFLTRFSFAKISDSAILLKGARKFQFENIEKVLNKKSHRTVFEINLNALEYNISYFKSLLKPQTGIIAMVKAFSYGSGSHEIANICQYQRVSALAVAYPDEGVDLRKNGIQLPILVMNPEQDNFQSLIEYSLEPEIFSFHSLDSFLKMAEGNQTKDYPIHLKLDTGMHRSGFMEAEIEGLVEMLKDKKNIRVKSVFSHLAAADEPQHDKFTHQQAGLFLKMYKQIQEAFPYVIQKHLLNSAGIERFPEYQFDYVRLGIGMYGISVSNGPVVPVGTLKSAIAQIKEVAAGETIGYSRKAQLEQNATIATVTIGYADGFNRLLSNGKGRVYVNGQFAPVIGNICMDMCMIDVTGLNVQEGDEVEILGKHIDINRMAEELNTIPYEVLTSISQRVRRIYHYE